MRAGKLDRNAIIKRPVSPVDTYGQPLRASSVMIASVSCAWNPLPGGDTTASDQRTTIHRAEMEIRYRDGLTTDLVVEYDGEDWTIDDIRESGRGRRDGLILLLSRDYLETGP